MPISIYAGIKAGCIDAFYIDGRVRSQLIERNPKSEEVIKPLVRGRDITAWNTNTQDIYLIGTLPALKINIDDYPAIKDHLLGFTIERLEQTGKEYIVNGEKIKARKKTCNKWFETQDQVKYYAELKKPKIIFPNITSVFPFTYDENGVYPNDNNFFIVEKENAIANEAECHPERTLEPKAIGEVKGSLLKALLAIFNSSLCKFWIWHNCPVLNGGTRKLQIAYFENLRIPLDNVELLQQLAALADEIIAAKRSLSQSKGTEHVIASDSEAIQRNIADLEKQVNTLVYQLYGVSDAEEIEAVEKR